MSDAFQTGDLIAPFTAAKRAQPAPAGWHWALRWIQLISVGIDTHPRWRLQTPGLPVSAAHGVRRR